MKELIFKIYNLVKCTIYAINGNAKKKQTIYIGRDTKVINSGQIHFSNNDIIGKNGYIACYGKGRIELGYGVNVGMYSMIASINSIKIGDNVLFGPNVYMADYNHSYEDISLPVAQQQLKAFDRGLVIGEDSWIGKNVTIVGGCTIGKHCIIGANSFVNKDIPDYSVCGGNPCRVIKRYDFDKNEWVRV